MISDGIYLDNDVVLKLCSYQSDAELLKATTISEVIPALLGVAVFTLRSRIDRSRNIVNREAARRSLAHVISGVRRLEPSIEEIETAAELEQRALEKGLELDTGESQLFAMMLRRNAKVLITGDKRALRALARLEIGGTDHRTACLEQLVIAILSITDFHQLRERVCAERMADKAITACFSCHSADPKFDTVLEGLRSYIHHLRKEAHSLLILSDDLSAVVP